MNERQPRLPERNDEILATGARLKVTLKERDGFREIEIVGNWSDGDFALSAIRTTATSTSAANGRVAG